MKKKTNIPTHISMYNVFLSVNFPYIYYINRLKYVRIFIHTHDYE